jgi:hypothetical protein
MKAGQKDQPISGHGLVEGGLRRIAGLELMFRGVG